MNQDMYRPETSEPLLREQYCMPTIDDILPQLANARCFSTCDLRDGFWHLRLDPASSRLTTFGTPFGRKRWLRLPFGISPSSEIFQSRALRPYRALRASRALPMTF